MDSDCGRIIYKAKLPTEVVLLIVENLIPDTSHRRPILHPSHIITKTLLSLTLVSKAVYPSASRLLWQNCLYIASKNSLHSLDSFISQKNVVTNRRPCEAYGSARLYLRPFPYSPLHKTTPYVFDEEATEEDVNSPAASWARPADPGFNDLATVEAINRVLITLAPVLKAVVVDMPLRYLTPEEDVLGVRKLLREGFEALVNVEELVSVNDELYLDTEEDSNEPEVWTKWPKLRRMALYNVILDECLWKNMVACPQLEVVVLTGADTEIQDIKIDWHREWAKAYSQSLTDSDKMIYQGPRITIAFCDVRAYLPEFDSFTKRWESVDPDNRIWVMTVPVDPFYNPARRERPGVIGVRRTWVKHRALSGSLWDDVYTRSYFSTAKAAFLT